MLQVLSIKNIALISDLTVEFSSGFNVLSGETGAGKSIIVDCVGLIQGNRGDKDLIQYGAQKAVVEAQFHLTPSERDLPVLQEYGIDGEDLVVSRELSLDGKNICRIDGRLVSLATLREITSHLINLHGQNQHTRLLDEKHHLGILDKFAGQEAAALLQQMDGLYRDWHEDEKTLRSIQMDEAEKARMEDMLAYQVDEIERADLKPGEEEELLEERSLLTHAETLATLVEEARSLLNDSGSAVEKLSAAAGSMEKAAGYNAGFQPFAETLREAYYTVQECAYEIASKGEEIVFDPRRLEEIEDRLALIAGMKRKYGGSVEEVLKFWDDAARRLEDLRSSERRTQELEEQIRRKKEALLAVAGTLSQLRRQKAAELETAIVEQLKDLGMEGAAFKVCFADKAPTPQGIDEVAFQITVNKGQPLRPLAKVISGGETSRIMLALKNIDATREAAGTLIFDEIDTGISGRIAHVTAKKIAHIADERQVICVTHLPQIAAAADTHFYIEKLTRDEKTFTTVRRLGEEELVREIARLSGGMQSEAALAHARELLSRLNRRRSLG